MSESNFIHSGTGAVGIVSHNGTSLGGKVRWLLACAVMALTVVFSSSKAEAALRLPANFGDGMVIQRDMPIPVWGWAREGETITVKLKGRTESAIADEQGRWDVVLAELPADDVSADLVVTSTGDRTGISFSDVVVGDVWFASGQSNMAWPVSRADEAEIEIESARYPLIRELAVARKTSTTPLEEGDATWTVCSPETVADFSAVGYFFARQLHRSLDVPIGIIHSSWGGTPIEAWTRRGALTADRRLMDIFVRWERNLGEYPEKYIAYKQAMKDWEERKQLAESVGSQFEERSPWPPAGPKHQHRPSNLYNAMVHPFTTTPIAGVIWYQGEANAWNPEEYAVSFPVMIRDWRASWGQPEMPFLFVQLSDYARNGQVDGGDWPWMREAQTAALNLPNTGMAVTIDIGDPEKIQPTNKQDVGARLARVALNKTYGQNIEYSGPLYKSMRVRRGVVELTFEHVAGGLAAFGSGVEGFEIAGEDRVFHRVTATIEDDKVLLSHREVDHPVAVRYAWDNSPRATLTNSEGLPAVPFRTDYWARVD